MRFSWNSTNTGTFPCCWPKVGDWILASRLLECLIVSSFSTTIFPLCHSSLHQRITRLFGSIKMALIGIDKESHVFQLPDSNVQITFLFLPKLNLYVISDAKGFGQNWVRVTFFRNIFETQLLMGLDNDDIISSIARHLAETVVKKKLANTSSELVSIDEINLTFSISLRNTNPSVVRLIKKQFDLQLNKPR